MYNRNASHPRVGAGPPGTLLHLFFQQDRAPKGARLQKGKWSHVWGFGVCRGRCDGLGIDWGIGGKHGLTETVGLACGAPAITGLKGGDGSIFGTQAVGLCQKNRGILSELIEA